MAVPAAGQSAGFDSPAAALEALEAAYVRKDIEAAVAAKDFTTEARRMMQDVSPEFSTDQALVDQTAETLELAFRKDIADNGFPNFVGLQCSVVQTAEVESSLHRVTEQCLFPDGGTSVQQLYVSKTDGRWKVVGLVK